MFSFSFLLRYAQNRYVNRLLQIYPELVFREVHAWPEPFSWTDKRVSLCLSFDCDTPKDAEVMPHLLALLEKYQIPASFAVIGALVEETPAVYKKIVAAGHEILSHGYSKHTEIDAQGEYHSTMFYHELSPEQIEDEIVQNHKCLENVFGIQVMGFRTPHFGTFQLPQQISLLYSLLKKHGYRYSSSVMMLYAKQRGYLKFGEGIREFPLSAIVGMPLSVFDSWSLLRAPGRDFTDADFFPLFRRMIDIALKSSRPIFLNVYFDPSHVVGFDGFEACLQYVSENKDEIWTGSYSAMLG